LRERERPTYDELRDAPRWRPLNQKSANYVCKTLSPRLSGDQPGRGFWLNILHWLEFKARQETGSAID
jgi:hypothetical protein